MSSSGVKMSFWRKLLYLRYRGSSLFVCCPVYALVYPIMLGSNSCCVVFVCCPVYALVYPIMLGRNSCCVVFVCIPVCALVYLILTGGFSCCVVCFCMWSCLCASVSHNAGSFLLFSCMWCYDNPFYFYLLCYDCSFRWLSLSFIVCICRYLMFTSSNASNIGL
jgi:hypothetical protein